MKDRVNPASLAHGAVDQTAEPASDEITRYQRAEGADDTDAILQKIVGQNFKLGSDGERSFLMGCRAALSGQGGGQGGALILALSLSRSKCHIVSMGHCAGVCHCVGGRGIIAD